MTNFHDHLKEELQDPEFKAEYEEYAKEREVIKALLLARYEQKLTQKQLAERSGIRQANISRIERGVTTPSLHTLNALAKGLGKKLSIKFI